MIETIASIDFDQLWAAITTIAACIGGVLAIVENIKKKNWKGAFQALNDLMNPYKPQTPEQTAIISKIDPETYTMTDEKIYAMWKELVAGRANLTLDALQHTVRKMEENEVEYVIVCHDNDGRGDTEPYYAFVSYGNYTAAPAAEIEKLSLEHGVLRKCYIGC